MRKDLLIGASALACAVALAITGGCASRRLVEGATPFPAKSVVMIDESGKRLFDLPASPEPLRIIVLDFPWCPACTEAWEAIAAVSKTVPTGNVRVYRILFDREYFETASGRAETASLRPAPLPPASSFPITTVTALSTPFRERYKVDQGPVVLLSDASGKVLQRWVGYTPALAESLREAIARRLK